MKTQFSEKKEEEKPATSKTKHQTRYMMRGWWQQRRKGRRSQGKNTLKLICIRYVSKRCFREATLKWGQTEGEGREGAGQRGKSERARKSLTNINNKPSRRTHDERRRRRSLIEAMTVSAPKSRQRFKRNFQSSPLWLRPCLAFPSLSTLTYHLLHPLAHPTSLPPSLPDLFAPLGSSARIFLLKSLD